jgi:hypothetical protein
VADFTDAILQKLEQLTDGQQQAREEMNAHFLRLNGRLRTAEIKLENHQMVYEEVYGPTLSALRHDLNETRAIVDSNTKTVSRVKTVVSTLTGTVVTLWAIMTNWQAVRAFLSGLFS